MTNRERLHAEVDSCQSFLLSQLADEAEESGDADLAAGYRWLRDHGRWPALTASGNHRWHNSYERGFHAPSNLWGFDPPGKHYARVSQALEAAAKAVWRGGRSPCAPHLLAHYESVRQKIERNAEKHKGPTML